MLTDRVRHYLNSVLLGCKTSIKFIHMNKLMAKTHTYSGFNGWHILYRLLYFFFFFFFFLDSWYSKGIEIKLMNYFSLASKNSNLERNGPFLAKIRLYFIRNKGNYFEVSRSQSFQEALDTATERDLWSLHFSHNLYGTMHETKIIFFFEYLINYA